MFTLLTDAYGYTKCSSCKRSLGIIIISRAYSKKNNKFDSFSEISLHELISSKMKLHENTHTNCNLKSWLKTMANE